jgi:hypothetical protein
LDTRKKAFIFMLLAGLFAAWPLAWAAKEGSPVPGVRLGAVIKSVYTHRERHERTGIEAVSEAGLRWVELDVHGDLGGGVGYRIDLAAGSGIYRDPITGVGTMAAAGGPGEFGALGVRRAEIEFRGLIPKTSLTTGTFIPRWGLFQQRPTYDWELVDLPLIYTSPAFKNIGWQNTGISIVTAPLDQIELSLFCVNGYFPGGLANSEPLLPSGGRDRGKALGGRLLLRSGPVSIFGGVLDEGWEEDLIGGPAAEQQHALAWIAGAELKTDKVWAAIEWSDLIIEEYQLRLDGRWMDLRSMGGHASAGWWMLDHWQALVRWEWIDPNTADTEKTFSRSRFDQVTQWTFGINYCFAPTALLMVNYVTPIEEGSRVDLDEGKLGGEYQDVRNNYFRIQVQVWQ